MSTKLRDQVSKWTKNIQFLLLPGTCIVCRKASGRRLDLCLSCETLLSPPASPCPGCGLGLDSRTEGKLYCGQCLKQRTPIRSSTMRFGWEEPVTRLISGFKYHQQLQHGRVLTDLLASHLQAQYQDRPMPDLLVPIPLHRSRLRQRGYNQALLIAQQLGYKLDVPVAINLLERIRATPAQQGLSARERKRNLRGAFAINNIESGNWPDVSVIALIDDVVTTMSTATTAAKALNQQLPDCELHLWALARA